MKNTINVDFINNRLVMTRAFAKLASDIRSEEYQILQKARHDYPNFSVEVRTIPCFAPSHLPPLSKGGGLTARHKP